MTDQAETIAAVHDAGRALLVDLLTRIGGAGGASPDPAALQRLYHLTAPKLNAVILAVLRDRALAEEVLQDAYVNVWRKAASFDPSRSSPITWLTSIARHRAIDRLRSERPFAADDIADHDIVDDHPAVIEQLIIGEDSERLRRCLCCLEADQQQAIRAAFFAGLTYEDFAAREGLPLSTVKSRIRRGLLRLRACMDRQ
jgi:RNA polymerase sigma factor (sigma-70 family)